MSIAYSQSIFKLFRLFRSTELTSLKLILFWSMKAIILVFWYFSESFWRPIVANALFRSRKIYISKRWRSIRSLKELCSSPQLSRQGGKQNPSKWTSKISPNLAKALMVLSGKVNTKKQGPFMPLNKSKRSRSVHKIS